MSSRFVLMTAAVLALSACGEAEQPAGKVVVTEQSGHLPDWLTPMDRIAPGVWLRSREVGHKVADSDPEVGRLNRALHQATARFYEDPRMIANRTSQIGTMLAEAGKPERLVDIMTGLVDVADGSPAKKLYGEMCQHYLNMRRNGRDRAETIKQLINAYKSAGTSSLGGKVP